jgi:dolichyl-diphosphooligosaccharide--protein glycosyltransferase
MVFSALLLILLVAFTVRLLPIRWEVETGQLHLSEFDPYYQYSLTKHMVEKGLFSPYYPTPWIDKQRWYPGGTNMGRSLSSLPMTAAAAYDIVTAFGVNIDLMSFCSFFPVILGTLAVFFMYFLGKDMGGRAVGLLSALFLALNPAVIQRNSLGFFDTETVGVFSLVLFSFLFLRAINEERTMGSTMKYSIGAAAVLAYFMMGWGGAYYMVDLTVLFVFALILLRRSTRRLFLAFSVTFGLALLIAINNPYLTTGYLVNYAILPVVGIFALLGLSEIIRNLVSVRGKLLFVVAFMTALVGGFVALWSLGYVGDIAGKFLTVFDPFLRASNPLVESVAEHRITAWGSIYYDLGIAIIFCVVGLFFVARNLTTRNLFLLIFGLTSLYFSASMVRLLIIFGPAFSLLAAVGVVGLLKPFMTLLREPPKILTKKRFGLERVGKEFSGVAVFLIFLILMTNLSFSPQTNGVPSVYRQTYAPVTVSAGSLPIVPNQQVREWLDMLKYLNDFQDSTIVVSSWWDYGYWTAIMGNVTSICDNETSNGTQIENVGYSFMANETQSVKMLKLYNAKYVLVFTVVALSSDSTTGTTNGVAAGYGDEGKWTWMARISGGATQDQRAAWPDWNWTDETPFGSFNNSTNEWEWSMQGLNTTIYKLMSWGRNRWCTVNGINDPQAANVTQPVLFKEEYFSGLNLTPTDASNKYGGLIPLVLLYKIDYSGT